MSEGETDFRPHGLVVTDSDAPAAPVKPDDVSWGDWLLVPDRPLRHRHETLAHLAALGASNDSIAKDLQLTPSRVCVLLSNTRIQERIKEIRAQYLGGDIRKRFEAAVPRAMDHVERVISGTEQVKTGERLQAATWLLEKVTGKAKQEDAQAAGNTVLQLLQALDGLVKTSRENGGVSPMPLNPDTGELIDVTPEERDPLRDWVEQNIPELSNEKGKSS